MLEQLLKGGYIMWPLIFLSILALAIIIDRFRAFKIASEVDTDSLFDRLRQQLEANDPDGAIKTCQESRGPVASVLLVGLYKFQMLREHGNTKQEVHEYLDKTMGEYAPQVIEGLEKRLYLLLMIASVSPLLGMTGTVTGMITSFDSMRSGLSGGAVAAGISEALITTATGLIIAIPAVVFYYVFSKRVELFRLDIEEKATDLVEFVSIHLRPKQERETETDRVNC